MLKMIAKGSTGQTAYTYTLRIRDSAVRFAWKINYPYKYRVGVKCFRYCSTASFSLDVHALSFLERLNIFPNVVYEKS